jgi:hypothetical protein
MTALVLRRALADYARQPLNLVLLVAVPVVIVVALSGEFASFSKLLSDAAKPLHLEVATAGWSAAAVAGLAGLFQVVGSRAPDRRLAAGSQRGAVPVVAGRLAAAGALAVAASAAALVALAVRGGIADSLRAIAAVLVVAVIYVAIGALVGTFVRTEMNGALIVSVIWMLDVFVGTGLNGSSATFTRIFPLHFPTMVLTGQTAQHGGPLSDVGWMLVSAGALASLATWRLVATTRPARHAQLAPSTTVSSDLAACTSVASVEMAPSNPPVAPPSTAAPEYASRSETAPPRPNVPTSRLAAGLWARRATSAATGCCGCCWWPFRCSSSPFPQPRRRPPSCPSPSSTGPTRSPPCSRCATSTPVRWPRSPPPYSPESPGSSW